MKSDAELRLECLKLVWPSDGSRADPTHYLPKAEALLAWIKSGGDTASRAPTTPADPANPKSGTLRK
jgi:hypothetical protein